MGSCTDGKNAFGDRFEYVRGDEQFAIAWPESSTGLRLLGMGHQAEEPAEAANSCSPCSTAARRADRTGVLVGGTRRGDYFCRLLLELHRATEANSRFAAEKVLPGIAYVRSAAYHRRFGHNFGKWLIVTTGERRLTNMLRLTERTARRDAGLFYFTTRVLVTPETVLIGKIWWRGGEDSPDDGDQADLEKWFGGGFEPRGWYHWEDLRPSHRRRSVSPVSSVELIDITYT